MSVSFWSFLPEAGTPAKLLRDVFGALGPQESGLDPLPAGTSPLSKSGSENGYTLVTAVSPWGTNWRPPAFPGRIPSKASRHVSQQQAGCGQLTGNGWVGAGPA